MRATLRIPQKLESYRYVGEAQSDDPLNPAYWTSRPREPFGAFDGVPGPCGQKLNIVVSDGELDGWEHVSVSLWRSGKARLPNWQEMCFVKDLFWGEEDCVVQFHPPRSEHVNNYRVLHLWRSVRWEFPRPPKEAVGIQALGELEPD